ncbi:hypothetical protein D3C78_363310 [compost metagenome]
MNRILVVKEEGHSANPEIGLVIPVAHFNDDGSIRPVYTGEFPNGGIFISKGFQNINQQFNSDEIFILNEYYESNDTDWQSNSRLQKHFAMGSKVERLERSDFVPVLNMPLPDIASGMINIDMDLPSNYFLIENDSYIHGPFKASKQDDSWFVAPLTVPSALQLKTDHIAKIKASDLNDETIVTLNIGGIPKKFVKSLRELSTLNIEQLDFISDVRLVSYFTKNGFGKGKNPLGKSEAQKLSSGIDEYVKKNKILANDARLKRLQSLLSMFLEASDYGKDIVHEFLADTRDGRLYLDNYFNLNKELLLKQKSDEIEKRTEIQRKKLEQEILEVERQILQKRKDLELESNNVEKEKVKAKERIEEIRKQSDEDAHYVLLEKQKELTEENQRLEKEAVEKKKNIDSFFLTLEKIGEYETLIKEIEYHKRRKQEIENETRVIEKALISQKAMLESPQLPDKLSEIRTLTLLLNGDKKDRPKPQRNKSELIKSDISINPENRIEYINFLVDKFNNDNGKFFSYDEMSNIIISISQSFMTVLAGPPGTGKTSTALRIAKHMGLSDPNSLAVSNFHNISVGRAWVSGRDILGFYNSLKDVYQTSRTGLYDFLKNEHNNEYLKLILLDEANLSSVEHYWSDFLGMCDPDSMKKVIDLGIPTLENRMLEIGDNTRFIATINNDATTEKLSPRLIDRVPIITLDHKSKYNTAIDNVVNFNGAVAFNDLNDCFNVSNVEASLTHDEDYAINQIIDILSTPINRTSAVRVSKRKVNAIKRYCHIANEIEMMRTQPLDFAICQHILPLIEGHGSAFKERLLTLEQKLTELDLSKSKVALKSIIDNGDIYGDSYSFF